MGLLIRHLAFRRGCPLRAGREEMFLTVPRANRTDDRAKFCVAQGFSLDFHYPCPADENSRHALACLRIICGNIGALPRAGSTSQGEGTVSVTLARRVSEGLGNCRCGPRLRVGLV